MQPQSQRPSPRNEDNADLGSSKPYDSSPGNTDPLDVSMSMKRVTRPMEHSISAPDAQAFQDALKALVNGGTVITSSDLQRRIINVQGAIDHNTLDTLVNQIGCTVTPTSGPAHPPKLTTLALGEEGQGRPRPRPIDATTMAVGEEGQAHP